MKRIILLILSVIVSFPCLYAQTPEASRMYNEIKSDRKKLQGYVETGFAGIDSTSVHDLAVLLYRDNDYKSAGACWEVALTKVKKYGKAYEQILEALSLVYLELNDINKIDWLMQVVEDYNQHEMQKNRTDYKSMLDRAQLFFNKGDEASAREYVKRSMDMCRDDNELAYVEENYARMLFIIGDSESASLYYYSAAKRLKSVGGSPESQGELLYKSALSCIISSKYTVAEARAREAIDCLADCDSQDGIAIRISCISVVAKALFCQQKYEAARPYYKSVLDSYSSMNPGTEKHAVALENMASNEVCLKQYDYAEDCYQQALDIYKSLGLDTKYSNTFSSLLVCRRKSGNNESADAMEPEAKKQRDNVSKQILDKELDGLEITRKYLSSNVYANSLCTIGGCYFGLGQYQQAADYYCQYVGILREMLRETFVVMDEKDRQRIWSKHYDNFDMILYEVTTLPEESLLDMYISTMYDMELLSKGILLSSSIEFGKVLNESGREDLVAIYEKLKENHKQIDQLQRSDSQQNIEKVLSLKQENIPLTNQLMNGCKEVRDYTNYLSYTWKDVQDALSDSDVAIEFVTLKASYSARDTFLAALVLKSTGNPQLVIVSTEAILRSLSSKDDLYDNPSYYKYIWGRLQQYIEGNGKIFFAPNNLLASIAIENLIDQDAPVFEKREVYRLSSTKELCKGRGPASWKTISIFGDIDYNSANASETKGGMAFGSLVYGAEEVDGIVNQIEGRIKPIVYRDSSATEKQFYELSNNCPDILHISSHGKYAGTEATKVEDAMRYSILALSGANRTRTDASNDGIVRASDVAEMNLRNCDLVVLSACESGLGGLGADGVFGLQRGFKNAGANSILMSLKPVYDESTSKLMIAFYAALAEGMTKREALVHAQKTLRENPLYQQGKFWAPFIILDALPN